MSDSMDEFREAQDSLSLQVGDSVVAYTYPLTEGIIIDRKSSEDGRLTLTLLVAPHQKKGKKWAKAKVSLRDAAKLSKKPPGKFIFPIWNVDKLRDEARRANADPIWVAAVKAALDKDFRAGKLSSEDSDQDNKDEAEESDEEERAKSVQIRTDGEESAIQKFSDLEKRMQEVLQLKSRRAMSKKKRRDKESEESDYEQWQKWKKEKRRQRRKKRRSKQTSSSASSSSSSSSSEEDFRSGEVGAKGKAGIFVCPFYKSDVRGVQDIKGYVYGQELTRRHVRIALHNLYAAHHTLVGFADKFVSQAYSSPFRPFSMDVAWFQAYAENIDEMLLNSLQGPWALWNEPVIDQMTLGFLDLLIRVSPNKNFPVCLHDTVRKWMKKQRVGTNSKFGPVSYAMQHAKFTEAGVVVQQVNNQRAKERVQNVQKSGQNNNPGSNFTGSRASTGVSVGGDKRTPPPS